MDTAIANAEGRAGLARLAEEQAALRRGATLVAQGVPPEEVFAAVTEEVGRLLPVDFADLGRFEPDGAVTLVAAWGRPAAAFPLAVGGSGGKSALLAPLPDRAPGRDHSYADTFGQIDALGREAGVGSAWARRKPSRAASGG